MVSLLVSLVVSQVDVRRDAHAAYTFFWTALSMAMGV
jgi:hypothetical protein